MREQFQCSRPMGQVPAEPPRERHWGDDPDPKPRRRRGVYDYPTERSRRSRVLCEYPDKRPRRRFVFKPVRTLLAVIGLGTVVYLLGRYIVVPVLVLFGGNA